MSTTTEAAAAALFAKLQTITGVVTCSRKFKHWGDVAPSQQPALFLRQTGNYVDQERGVPSKITISFELAVYAHADNSDDIPQSIQNGLIDKIHAALVFDNIKAYCLTLGGTCSHCWIEGEIETDEGLLGQQTVALIPIRVLINL